MDNVRKASATEVRQEMEILNELYDDLCNGEISCANQLGDILRDKISELLVAYELIAYLKEKKII